MPPVNQITQKAYEKHAWIIFLASGIFILIFIGFNFLLFPSIDAKHWDWLTSDSEVVNYLRTSTRAAGLLAMGFASLTIAVSLTGYRKGEKWSWYTLWYLPVFFGLLALVWPWLWPLLTLLVIISLLGLILPYRKFFRVFGRQERRRSD